MPRPLYKINIMATYQDLLPNSYYLLQESENANLQLVFVLMATEKAILLEFQDDDQTLVWNKKTDSIYEIVEKLTEEQAVVYESLLDDEEEDDDDDDDLASWFEDDDEDEDDEEDEDTKIRTINN